MDFNAVLSLIIGFIIVLATMFLMTRDRKTIFNVCIILFLFSFVTGFVIYTLAYLQSGQSIAHSLFASLKGIYSVGRMFIIEVDRTAISSETSWIFDNIWIEIIFWICHALALIVVQTALISFFARRFSDMMRLWFGSHRTVYIIIGNSKNAHILGENIATKDAGRKRPCKDRLVLYLLDEEDDAKETLKAVSFFGALLFEANKNGNLIKCIRKLGLGKRFAFGRKYKIILFSDKGGVSENVRSIAEYAKSKNVKREDLQIYALTSSEWDKTEIEVLSKETEISDTGLETRKFLYAIHIVSEIDSVTRNMLEILSPYECLAAKNALQNGRAYKNFTVMIVGFGETGQSALLRLMMNGQFVGSSMRAIIADVNLNVIYDRFIENYPAVNLCCDFNKTDRIDADVLSKTFYEKLTEIGNGVDYVAISLGDEEINRKAALDLRRYYMRNGGNTPDIAVLSKEESFTLDNIFSFGQRNNVYKESVIIDQENDYWAMKLNSGYSRGQLNRSENDRIEWDELNWFSQESKRAQADFLPYMLKLSGFSDEQKEILTKLGEIYVCIDANKKSLTNALKIGDTSLADSIRGEISEYVAKKEALSKELSLSETLKETLAHTEHLRWNAFHAAMGYAPISLEEMFNRYEKYDGNNENERRNICRKDEFAKVHLCLVHWDELDKYYEEYLKINPAYKDFKEMDYDGVFTNIAKYLYLKSCS